MSVTGIALILFLTFHMSMNVAALFSAEGYNMICEFLGANWYAVVATCGLAGLAVLHIFYAFWLTMQNRRARGNNSYEVTDKPAKVEWASQNMLVLGIIIAIGLVLHLYHFWYNMMFQELVDPSAIYSNPSPADGYAWIEQTFANPVNTILYLIWFADTRLERQDMVLPLEGHRHSIHHSAYGRFRYCGNNLHPKVNEKSWQRH